MRCPVCGNEKGETHICASCGTALYDEIRSPFAQEDNSSEPYIIYKYGWALGTLTAEMTKRQFIVASSVVLLLWTLIVYVLFSQIFAASTNGWWEGVCFAGFAMLIPAMWLYFWASGRGEVIERQRKEKCFGPPSEKRP